MLKLTILLCLLGTGFSVFSKTDPALSRMLRSGGFANVFVSFEVGTSSVLESLTKQHFATRGEKISTLKLLLEENAAKSQMNVRDFLNAEGFSYDSFWINNQIFVQSASFELVEAIARFPEVSMIAEEEEFQILHPVEIKMASGPSPSNEWGVNLIQAPEAWSLDGGNNGANVRIGTIDTGVLVSHEALRANYHGKNGWFDPYENTQTPNDQNGHGTHVTGTIAGQGGIGVAPGSTWLACKGCATFFCMQDALLKCGQFMLCPTDAKGNNPDCSQAPHLVSNSWGGGQGRDMYHAVADAWIAADIIPVFANGNSGPTCGSANSPADYKNIIGVGSTTSEDSLSSFSSVGPSVYGTIKPDVSAPGSNVLSSYHTSDTAYTTLSGTSMACPHAAGVIALLKGRNQTLSFEEVKRHLTSGTDRGVKLTGKNCGGIEETKWPNNAFGYGRINAFKALRSLLQQN